MDAFTFKRNEARAGSAWSFESIIFPLARYLRTIFCQFQFVFTGMIDYSGFPQTRYSSAQGLNDIW